MYRVNYRKHSVIITWGGLYSSVKVTYRGRVRFECTDYQPRVGMTDKETAQDVITFACAFASSDPAECVDLDIDRAFWRQHGEALDALLTD